MSYDLVAFEDTGLSEVDALTRYCQQIKKFTFLSPDEELDLAYKYIKHNDLEAAHRLITSHLRYVVMVAHQYKGYGLPLGDLVQEGNIGLMKAVKRFDPAKGVRLSSYALMWIKAEIGNYVVNNWRMLKVATTKVQRKIFFNLRKLQQSFGFLPEDEMKQIAEQLNVDVEDVREMEPRMRGKDVSIFVSNEEDEYDTDLLSVLSDDDADPSKVLENQEQLEADIRRSIGLFQSLKQLDERSRRIVTSRWLNEDDNATLEVLSKEFNISKERVRQIEVASLQKLKHLINN